MSRKLLFYTLPLVLFVICAGYILVGQYSDMLFTAQDRNEFFTTTDFFCHTVSDPFGLMTYLGSYLTQFFYYPALGASLLILLWCAIYVVTIKAFGLSFRWSALALLPLGCLCVSITDVGYWVYILLLHGYWFSETITILIVLLMLWAARCTSAKRRASWYIIGSLIAFPIIGWGCYLFALCFFATQCAESADRRMPFWHHLCGLLLVILVPFFYARHVYVEMNIYAVLQAGIPYFQSSTVDALRPSYPFILLAVFLLLLSAGLPLWRKECDKVKSIDKFNFRALRSYYGVTVLSLLLFWGINKVWAFDNYNFQAEMRMNQAAMEDDWQTIIREAEKAEAPSRTMVLFKNIALLNTGELGNRGFQIGASGVDINNIDSLNLNVMQIASPLIYYHYGKIQFATRWCMENAVGYGNSPYYMKVYVRAAQETHEPLLMQRYLHLLSLTSFHKDWRPLPSTPLLHKLNVGFSDVIDSDNNDLERYVIENFSLAMGSDISVIKELNLFYSMIYRDPSRFWPAFHAYAGMHMFERVNTNTQETTRFTQLPIHYQEAYLIMQENYPVELPYSVEIAPMVNQNYQLYKQAVSTLERQGLDAKAIGEQLYGAWRHTYWYYIMYGRKAY